ncbi:MAG: hypothetical protein PVG93_05620 [Phycisphaerales bacterium]
MCASEFQIVKDAVAGHKEVDEQALTAVAVLGDRLERIKSFGGSFGSVGFSPDVEKLQRYKSPATVG